MCTAAETPKRDDCRVQWTVLYFVIPLFTLHKLNHITTLGFIHYLHNDMYYLYALSLYRIQI